MASTKFMKAQVGLQSTFGTAVAPTIQVPWRGRYEDQRQNHEAEYDAGTWTPTSIVTEVAQQAMVTFEGTAFFELLPVLLNSGYEDVAPSGTYIHTYVVSPAAIATPKPLTALIGAVGTNIGGTGPAVKFKDLYLRSLTLAGNINDKAVTLTAEMFGTTYDDNSGAGYAFASVNLPATIEVINALKGVLRYQDVTTTGGDFATMTDMECTLLDWELALTTGIEPAWCLTDETTTWSALKYTTPTCEFRPVVRLNSTTYAAIKAKADARTFQELQLFIAGTSGHDLTVNMTGLWNVVPTVHDDQDGELVMRPTFITRTPHTQTTTPHFLTVIVESTHNWT